MTVKGRDLVTGLPLNFTLSSVEIRDALSEPVTTIVDAVRMTLEKTPPELSADIMEHGVVLTGGGALLHGLGKRFNDETQIPVQVAPDPLSCVALGTGAILEELKYLMPAVGSTISRLSLA